MTENPYASNPHDLREQSIEIETRPISVTVFGILNLVFAALGLCGLGFSIITFMISQNSNMPNPVMEMMRTNQFYMSYMYAVMLLGLVFTVVLVVAGIGLLRFKPYGRTLSIIYSVYSIVICIVGTAVNYFALVAPLLNDAQKIPNAAMRAGAIGGAIGGMVGGLLGLIYPVLLLVFMYRRNVMQALRAEASEKMALP